MRDVDYIFLLSWHCSINDCQ